MAEKERNVFRKKALERISSPEQLTEYLRVTNPGIWVVLLAVILVLGGLFAWATVGTLETRVDAVVIVEDHVARVVSKETVSLDVGMKVYVAGYEAVIVSLERDEYGRSVGKGELLLPDGTYDAKVVVEQTKPIDFLLKSR